VNAIGEGQELFEAKWWCDHGRTMMVVLAMPRVVWERNSKPVVHLVDKRTLKAQSLSIAADSSAFFSSFDVILESDGSLRRKEVWVHGAVLPLLLGVLLGWFHGKVAGRLETGCHHSFVIVGSPARARSVQSK